MEKMINEGRNNDIAMMRDMYRDVFGSRPTTGTMNAWSAMNDEEFGLELDHLSRMATEEIEREKAQENAAAVRFEARINTMMADHSIDRETAIRWDIQANDMEQDIKFYGMDYYAYENGLPGNYFAAR